MEKELRIGNLVAPIRPRHGEKYIEVESISFEYINRDFREYSISEINPIPLTEEWLDKFGFIKESGVGSDVFTLKGFYTLCRDSNGWGRYSIEWRDATPDFRLLYVHQLQNLYFALTGEELQIK